jgi:hypothetical protein
MSGVGVQRLRHQPMARAATKISGGGTRTLGGIDLILAHGMKVLYLTGLLPKPELLLQLRYQNVDFFDLGRQSQ